MNAFEKLNALEIILSESPEFLSHPAWKPFCARFKGRESDLECSPVRSAWRNYRDGWNDGCASCQATAIGMEEISKIA